MRGQIVKNLLIQEKGFFDIFRIHGNLYGLYILFIFKTFNPNKTHPEFDYHWQHLEVEHKPEQVLYFYIHHIH